MDFGTFLVRTIADLLYNKPAEYETKDIHKEIEGKINSDNIVAITKRVLKAMFCENTGTHFLDSGGAYGRGWQRKQAIKDADWDLFPYTHVEISSPDDWYVLKNTYHFLMEHIQYDVKMDKLFHAFCNQPVRKKEPYYQCMRQFRDFIGDRDDFEYYTGGNTYNGDTCLDETLQYDIYRSNNYDFIILQTHNGADVRGGYSTPHVFSLEDADSFLCMMDDLCCRCPNWDKPDDEKTVQLDLNGEKVKYGHVDCYSDDCGYHWYSNYNGREGSTVKDGAKFIKDEDENYHIVCGKCGAELEFF